MSTNRSSPIARGQRCGFTVLELIVVIAIMGTLSVTAIGIFTGDTEYRLDAAAKKIASDIRYAQQLAMDNHGTYTITFSAASDSYSLYDERSTKTLATDPYTGSSYTVQFDSDIYSGVTITEAAFGASTSLSFDDEGNASSAGKIAISVGKTSLAISVLSTGLVQVASPTVSVMVK